MSRVAAIYDIHGNLPALEAVLNDIRDAAVDQVIIGGDVLPGPMPRETIACLLDLDVPVQFIRGNGDRVVLAQMTGKDISEVPEQFREVIRWTAQQLHPEHERTLASWPATCRVEIRGLGEVLFCHATPRNDTECFTRSTPEDRLVPVFEGVNVPLVVCGHTHMQFDRTIGRIRVVNAGSVGMPFAPPPGAYWLLLGPDVQLRHTAYDVMKAAERIRDANFPHAEDLAVRYVLHPPSEVETLELFAKVELR
ncbi:MAG: metallophosphoesterase family protein [Acidobacteria bacterium]|nr:metallophosphoesterase family protein [Acidobacteriota bacterium]